MMNTSLTLNSEIKIHPPCMTKEIIEILEPYKRKVIVDATFGTGGHSLEIIKNTKGNLFAFEVDPFLYERAKKILKEFENTKIFNKSFTEIPNVLKEEKIEKIDGIIFDFGVSFYHISSSKRGFSFKKNEILDMRYNPLVDEPLYKKIKKLNISELEDILKNYGELKNYKKIAINIFKKLRAREIKYTEELNEAILDKIRGNKEKILQKVYQAFRIWINDEIKNIQTVFSFLPQIIEKGGRVIFLSYHSIEDRLVKNFLKNKEFKILTKKPLLPTEEEIKLKPNCRSCKLRAAEKL
ncbi:MAG: 16S rRNA (cytosine(1402)-N(4))-methyltransferase RsmH [Candidatus Hydrothermales bacterium]